jgi:hypothetical protein
MKISYIREANLGQLLEINFDLILGASGYESRASYLFSNNIFIGENRVCFSFKNNKKHSREKNDALFASKKFEPVEIDHNSANHLAQLFYTLISKSKGKDEIKILVDYSCMSTLMYASIFKCFYEIDLFEKVSIYFSYTQSVYSKPSNRSQLKHHSPISLLNNIELTDKKIALIIGLGYERDKALGLYEYFQSDLSDMYLFMTLNNKFSKDVVENNSELMAKIDKNNIIEYDLNNVPYLVSCLDSLTSYLLNNNFRVVISPTGPKLFSLAALIIGMYHNNVSIYRSSMGDIDDVNDKIADTTKDLIITEVNFVNDKYIL